MLRLCCTPPGADYLEARPPRPLEQTPAIDTIPLLPLSSFRAPIGSQHAHGSIESTAVHDDKLGDLSSLASG
jgi:hypothetical protein